MFSSGGDRANWDLLLGVVHSPSWGLIALGKRGSQLVSSLRGAWALLRTQRNIFMVVDLEKWIWVESNVRRVGPFSLDGQDAGQAAPQLGDLAQLSAQVALVAA
jgi:hypothetical protein